MSGGRTANLVALLSPLFLMAGLRACPADDGPPKRYSSPKAVFDAYREAHARRDWRTCFPLLTRKMQDYTTFEHYLVCLMFDSEKTRAVLKRFGVDEATLTSDLRREHKAKHGVEPADDKALWDALEEEYKAEHGAPPHSPPVLLTSARLTGRSLPPGWDSGVPDERGERIGPSPQ